jgi:hypothetical protein
MALADSLISFWELEAASGTRNDSHGSNHLTDNNTVAQAAGKVGNCADFELANSEYLSCASNATLQMGDIDFTIAAWVNLETKSQDMQIVAKDVDTPGSSRDYTLDFALASLMFRFYINGGGAPDLIVSSADLFDPALATWFLLVAWHNAAADTLNLQVNNGTPNSHTTSGTVPQTSSAEFRIGARAYASFEGYFDGLIDQVGIWKRVLTSDERTALYNGGNGLAYAAFAPATTFGYLKRNVLRPRPFKPGLAR